MLPAGDLAHLCLDIAERRLGRGDVPVAGLSREALADRARDRVQRDRTRSARRIPPTRAAVRHRNADVLARDLARRDAQPPVGRSVATNSPSPSSSMLLGRVDQQVARRLQPLRTRPRVGEGAGSWTIRPSGSPDRLAGPQRASADPAERHNPGPRGPAAQARERERVAALDQGRDREQLGRGHHALAVTAVEPSLKQRPSAGASGVARLAWCAAAARARRRGHQPTAVRFRRPRPQTNPEARIRSDLDSPSAPPFLGARIRRGRPASVALRRSAWAHGRRLRPLRVSLRPSGAKRWRTGPAFGSWRRPRFHPPPGPRLPWNRSTAASVRGPYRPSTGPGRSPARSSRCWIARTRAEPCGSL